MLFAQVALLNVGLQGSEVNLWYLSMRTLVFSLRLAMETIADILPGSAFGCHDNRISLLALVF